MNDVNRAIDELKYGRFILLHDGKDREDEVDIIIPAQYVRPEHIAVMRRDAGGLICLALSNTIASRLGLLYMHDILRMINHNSILPSIVYGNTPYGDRPSFSITINHRDTYTGVTDKDRALTISAMAAVAEKVMNGNPESGISEFISSFKSPGHVPLLIAAKSLSERRGHTEMAVRLAEMAGLVPAVAVCEMLDSTTFTALSVEKAYEYAKENNLCIIEGYMLE